MINLNEAPEQIALLKNDDEALVDGEVFTFSRHVRWKGKVNAHSFLTKGSCGDVRKLTQIANSDGGDYLLKHVRHKDTNVALMPEKELIEIIRTRTYVVK